jgi:hypothetical protein
MGAGFPPELAAAQRRFVDAHVAMGAPRDEVRATLQRMTRERQ